MATIFLSDKLVVALVATLITFDMLAFDSHDYLTKLSRLCFRSVWIVMDIQT